MSGDGLLRHFRVLDEQKTHWINRKKKKKTWSLITKVLSKPIYTFSSVLLDWGSILVHFHVHFFTIKQIQLLHGWGTWVQLFVTHTVELQGLIEWFTNFLSRGAGLFWFIFINPLISYFDIIIVSLNLLAPDQTHRSVNFGYLHSRNDWQLSFRLWITFLWLTLLIPVEPGKQVLYFTHPGVRLALCDVNFAVA